MSESGRGEDESSKRRKHDHSPQHQIIGEGKDADLGTSATLRLNTPVSESQRVATIGPYPLQIGSADDAFDQEMDVYHLGLALADGPQEFFPSPGQSSPGQPNNSGHQQQQVFDMSSMQSLEIASQPTSEINHEAPSLSVNLGYSLPSIFDANKLADSGIGAETRIGTESVIQRLSTVSFKFSTEMARLDKAPSAQAVDELISPLHEGLRSQNTTAATLTPVDNILNATREFQQILSEYKSSLDIYGQTSALGDSGVLSFAHNSTSNSWDNCTDGSTTTSVPSSISSPSLQATPTANSSSSEAIAKAQHSVFKNDGPTLLLILTCYLQMVDIYIALFSHVHQFLVEVSASENPCLCPVPGISFSNFPLQSGNLQATILIQIVTNLLERVDDLLGLPEKYRLTTKSRCEGLLSDKSLTKLFQIVMKKEGKRNDKGGNGGIGALRKLLKKNRRLLTKSIAP
ncbi:hypothetical protein DL764_000395 [Monosporascus ibericus]|uniref:Uncharacterized protein n=1 Tax=Monosporascus ibericus TaxID=155417 RepID=A0A4Q4TYW2_9PEZI|nr:hypothetical protein DL764_000395 [Monosporascus ibericus]